MTDSNERPGFEMTSVKIASNTPGWDLAAWRYLPTKGPTPCPVIVMAHGLTSNKLMSLAPYAEAFANAGYACVVFDYRRWGASDGIPRHCLHVTEQLEDYRTVIKYCRQQPDLDPQRVVVWGTSFSGGHCITLASERSLDLFAAIAQCPYTGNSPRSFDVGFLKTIALGIFDLVKQACGFKPAYIPGAGQPGGVGALTAPGAIEGLFALARTKSDYPNQVAASGLFEIPFYKPSATASSIECPILLVAPELDNVCPLKGTLEVAQTAFKGEIFCVPGDHFSPYPGQLYHKQSLSRQLQFLKEQVAL